MASIELESSSWAQIVHVVDDLIGGPSGDQSSEPIIFDLGSRADAAVIGAATAEMLRGGHTKTPIGQISISLSSFVGSPILLVVQQIAVIQELCGKSLILRNDAATFGDEILAAVGRLHSGT